MSEQLRSRCFHGHDVATCRQCARLNAPQEDVPGVDDVWRALTLVMAAPTKEQAAIVRAALAAAPSTPEPLTYIGGVPHNHDRNRECREVLVGACLVARLRP